MDQELQNLKLKKARLFSELEMLSEVSDLFYKNLGKVTADIHLLEMKILRETKNDLEA
jgi:hypothetical protein